MGGGNFKLLLMLSDWSKGILGYFLLYKIDIVKPKIQEWGSTSCGEPGIY